MNAWVVNDNDYDREALSEDILSVFPDASVKTFETLYDAHQSAGRPDLLVIDLSSVAPVSFGSSHHYGPIAQFLELRPSVKVIIASAVSASFSEEVKEDVLSHVPSADVRICVWPAYQNLPKLLRECAA